MIAEIILKQLSILVISAIKFLVAAPTSYLFGYSYIHTIINMIIGGLIGVLFFYYSGRWLFAHYPVWKRKVIRFYHKLLGIPYQIKQANELYVPKKVFTRKNRTIIKIREKFGFAGLIILTPVLLSIPLGTFIAVKYYSRRRDLLGWLSISVVGWSILLSTFIMIF
jgi:hypothetical protein